ncbi:hypothetical protein NC651_011148 [Populus alba x Populus x berolinensis]|uniref:Uncharacterized protein n=1 Tax=Populus alba x Populus x berolinensis TaxID=444605 RepID=A0AAD6W6D2_9ROSI|nr:hypothetical protein NC651_011148 [Populus alba x Populus x berolinensis]KAJ7000998.1 hypothetical protein NC653_011444 [Populus alba x Populus x berolinensis]
MANSRIAKFITEAAPPQYINVIRHRASKLLDTISEEDRDVAASVNESGDGIAAMYIVQDIISCIRQQNARRVL